MTCASPFPIEYEWREFWSAVIGLLGFLSNKLDSLVTTGGVEHLSQQVGISGIFLVAIVLRAV